MSKRNITALMEAASAERAVEVIFLFEADFPSGFFRAWTGVGQLTWNNKTWEGVGDFITLSQVEEATDTASKTISVTLSGIQEVALLRPLAEDNYSGRDGSVWMGFVDSSGIVADPYQLFQGTLDSDEIRITESEASVTMTLIDYMGDLLRPRIWRYTHEDQQALFPDDGDKGLEFVPQLQNLQINWGKPGNSSARGGGSARYR